MSSASFFCCVETKATNLFEQGNFGEFLHTLLDWYERPGSSSRLAMAWQPLHFTARLPNRSCILCTLLRSFFLVSRVDLKKNSHTYKIFILCEDGSSLNSTERCLLSMDLERKLFIFYYARNNNDGVIVSYLTKNGEVNKGHDRLLNNCAGHSKHS